MTGPAHIFYEAKEYGADIDLHFVSISDDPKIESTSGLNFSELLPFHRFQLSAKDFIFVPGMEYRLFSDPHFMESAQAFFKWLHQQYKNGVTVCSVCTGAFLLAEAGILDGKSGTTHWKYFPEFAKKYPLHRHLHINHFEEWDGLMYFFKYISSFIINRNQTFMFFCRFLPIDTRHSCI